MGVSPMFRRASGSGFQRSAKLSRCRMTLSDLSTAARSKIENMTWDSLIEKHEGPVGWRSTLRFHEPEFMRIRGIDVLLPVGRDQHENITVLRCIPCKEGNVLTLFLKDTSFLDDPKDDAWMAGRIAVCERPPRESFYVATVYHEWFIPDAPQR